MKIIKQWVSTFRTQDHSVPRHFGTSGEVSIRHFDRVGQHWTKSRLGVDGCACVITWIKLYNINM